MDTATASEIGRRVEEEIADAGLSKSSVAETAGIPWATFSRKVNGHSEFSASEMIRISAVLNISPARFLPTAFRQAVAA